MNRPAWFPYADALHRAVVEHRNRVPTPDGQEGEPLVAYDDRDGIFLAMGLAGEAGEVANEFKKWMRGDYTREEFLAKLAKELGDVRCMLELVARQAGLDLDVVTPAKLEEFEGKLLAKGWLAAPVAVRPMEPGARIFVCLDGHETQIISHPIGRMACQHKDGGDTCSLLATAKVWP